ncbi:MAG: elongation factor G [Deltaproteobacteria bacterium]|nr:elongation factor G [Deltaproteobacteria bacterium]
MQRYPTERIRNICLVGAKGTGKTSLAEALLFNAKVINRLGKVEEGNTTGDYDPLEISHRPTLTSKVLSFEWKETKINLIDTPGFADFFGEALAVMSVSDVVCLCLDAAGTGAIETKKFLDWVHRLNKPLCFFVNRLDAARANWQASWQKIQDGTGGHAVLFALPAGEGGNFKGIVDLVAMRTGSNDPIPAAMEAEAKQFHTKLIEDAAEESEALMEKYLEAGELSRDDLQNAFAAGIGKRDFFPVFAGSASQNIGVANFLNLIVEDFPPPRTQEKTAAQVFKITADPGLGEIFYLRLFSGTLLPGTDLFNSNRQGTERLGHLFVMRGKERLEVDQACAGDIVATAKLKNTGIGDTLCLKKDEIRCDPIPFPEPSVSFALQVASRAEQDKLGLGLSKLMRTDPTFHMHIDKEFAETIVSGMGEQHIEVMVERLKERYGVKPELGKPHIPYRETITKKAEGQGKYKKQTGGHGQYGDCWLRLEPLARGKGFAFASEIKGGAIPSKFIPSVEKGVRQAIEKGVLAAYPVVDLKVVVYDGSYHDVDSSDLAFQIAASMAFKKVEEEAKPILLEPIMNVEITTPAQYVGDVTSDISSRRGRVQSMENSGELDTIKAQIPQADLYKYSTRLRSMTSGAAAYTMSFSHYEPVPPQLAPKVMEERKREKGTE